MKIRSRIPLKRCVRRSSALSWPYAFAADISRRIKVEPVRSLLEDFMAAQHGLPQDLRITDLGGAQEAAR